MAEKSKKSSGKNDSNAKKPFTIRLEEKTIEYLSRVGKELNSTPAAISRNYLSLSKFFITHSNLKSSTYDGRTLSMIPKEIFNELLLNTSPEYKYKFGDNLGIVLITNSQILGLHNIHEKIELIKGLGWIDITIINEADGRKFYGFPKKFWPLETIHALLYRILENREFTKQFDGRWTTSILREFLPLGIEDLKKRAKDDKKGPNKAIHDEISRYRSQLGGRMLNFDETQTHFVFDRLLLP
jgi:hypothetical protein